MVTHISFQQILNCLVCLGFFPENGPEMKMKSTGVDRKVLKEIGHVFSTPPNGDGFENFKLHNGNTLSYCIM